MPVLVTGATGFVGRALVRRLAAGTGQVRAYVRRDDGELRALGAYVAIGSATDEGRLEAAMEQVHTVAHLVGGSRPPRGVSYDRLNRETVEVAVAAARNAGVTRLLYLSLPGADPSSPNEYLAAKGKAEHIVRESGLEHAILRCAEILGAGGGIWGAYERLRRAPVAVVPGRGDQRLNPVALDDVVEALARADDRDAEVRATWELGGPDVVTFDELVDLLVGPKRKVHLARLPGVPSALSALHAAGVVVDPSEVVAQLGLTLTPLSEAIARGRAAAPQR